MQRWNSWSSRRWSSSALRFQLWVQLTPSLSGLGINHCRSFCTLSTSYSNCLSRQWQCVQQVPALWHVGAWPWLTFPVQVLTVHTLTLCKGFKNRKKSTKSKIILHLRDAILGESLQTDHFNILSNSLTTIFLAQQATQSLLQAS